MPTVKTVFTLITVSVYTCTEVLVWGWGKCGYPLLDGTLPIDNASQLDISHKKQLRSCIMDDHLFINLRTVCSRFVTVGEMKISYFLHFSPPLSPLYTHTHTQIRQSLAMCWLSSAEDGDVRGVRQSSRQARMCDAISGTFLRLWQMTVFSPLSWPQHLLLQIHPPPLLRLGRMSWQLSDSRCFTDEKQPPRTPPTPFFLLPLTC